MAKPKKKEPKSLAEMFSPLKGEALEEAKESFHQYALIAIKIYKRMEAERNAFRGDKLEL